MGRSKFFQKFAAKYSMNRKSKPFSLLVKPASADCNLKCEYCFYLDRCELYPGSKIHRMSDDVLEKIISSYMQTEQPSYSFCWQGGEPTLMGLDFFTRVTEFQKKYGAAKSATVANGLQTNAILINDEMAEHFAKHNFLIGVSLDGPEGIHNTYRKKKSGSGSHSDVLSAIEVLRRHKVEFNILVLVSRANVAKCREVFSYLVEKGFFYHQYNPCVEFDSKGKLLPFSKIGEEWGKILCELTNCWLSAGSRKISIRLFDSILNYLVYGIKNVCTMGRDCRQYFVVEYNGDVYPCDFFVRKELKLGNIMENSWEELLESEKYEIFGKKKCKLDSICEKCEFLSLCYGDCLKHRPPGDAFNPQALSSLCEGQKIFFRHSMAKLKNIAQKFIGEHKK